MRRLLFVVKVRDIEATKNSIFVTVAGVYESGELFGGQASLKIIGKNERPKTGDESGDQQHRDYDF